MNGSGSDLAFTVSYASALRWVRRLSWLLGGDDFVVTTHTFRRSGASELARQGTPLADILVYGRWQSDRSAREYIRQGEVAIHRTRQAMNPQLRRRVVHWASLVSSVWVCYKRVHILQEFSVKVDRMTMSLFEAFEQAIFSAFNLPV